MAGPEGWPKCRSATNNGGKKGIPSAAYLIVEILRVHDEQTYATYRSRVSSQLREYGGEYLARGGKIEQLEGKWLPKRIVVVRFESLDAAKRWWSSPDYAELKALRQASTDSNMIVVEGVSKD